MINVQFEGEYDAEKNIIIVKFINKSLNTEDIDYTVSQTEYWAKQGGENKVWAINDLSKMGMASTKLVQYYKEQIKPIIDKYIIDYCTVCEKTMERIAVQLFNVLMRDKHPIFKTIDEAMEWTLKEQEARGRFIPL